MAGAWRSGDCCWDTASTEGEYVSWSASWSILCDPFDDIIDEVRIWDHARDEAEIAGQMDCALTGTEPGLLAYYSFNSGDAWDDSGQGHIGVVEGAADYVDFSQDCMVLFDDFESGDTSAWSIVVP